MMSGGPVLPGVKINLKVPEDVTRDTVSFARRILGPLAEIGDLFSDKVRFLRFRSAAKTLNRAAEIAKENGISPKAIPMKFLVPFIEDCSLEEEDSPFIEQWAALLASASKGFDPLHVAIRDVLKNISAKEADLIGTLGTAIDAKLLEDKVSSYQIAEHIDVNIRGIIGHHALKFFKVGMPDSYIDRMLRELTRAVPVIPIFYHIPVQPGVTKVIDTNYSGVDRGSIFLLERLEILESEDTRFQVAEDPDIADVVISYAKLTAFGVEVFRECVGLSEGGKRKPLRKKRAFAATIMVPRV
jgi:hypothetical protein